MATLLFMLLLCRRALLQQFGKCVCVCVCVCMCWQETERIRSDVFISSQPSSSNGTPKPFTNVTNTSLPCGTTTDTMFYEDTFAGSPSISNSTTDDTCAGPLNATEIYYISLVSLLVHVQCGSVVLATTQDNCEH